MDRYRTALLFGGPGAGKGTQGSMLGRIPGFCHVSTGEMFRNLSPDCEIGRIFHDYSSRGDLVPDDLTVRLWQENMRARITLNMFRPSSDLLFLDGIPRTPEQAGLMDRHIEVVAVIHLTCHDKDMLFDRLRRRALKENRVDDAKEEVIRRRWEVYMDQTRPVLAHYDDEIVHEIDAIGSPASVLREVLDVVTKLEAAPH